MVTKGYCGKITDISDFMPVRHRTNIGKFLSDSPWNDDSVERALKKRVIARMWETSRLTKKPIYVVIDDTISEKTVPSSKLTKMNIMSTHIDASLMMSRIRQSHFVGLKKLYLNLVA